MHKTYAPVAQWIEHRIPVPRVGGSSPFWRTISFCHNAVCASRRDSKRHLLIGEVSFYLLCDHFRPAYCVGSGFLRLLERLVKFSHGRLDQDFHFVRIKVNALLLKQRLSLFSLSVPWIVVHTCSTACTATQATARLDSSVRDLAASCFIA